MSLPTLSNGELNCSVSIRIAISNAVSLRFPCVSLLSARAQIIPLVTTNAVEVPVGEKQLCEILNSVLLPQFGCNFERAQIPSHPVSRNDEESKGIIDNNKVQRQRKNQAPQSNLARFPLAALGKGIPLPTLLAKELLFGAAGPAAES